MGRRADRGRVAPDPDLRRPAGADQRLLELRQAQRQPGDRAGRRRGGRRGRRGERGGDGARQPDLLRHGVLQPHLLGHRRDPRLPRGLDRRSCTRSATSPASTAAAPPGSPTSAPRSAAATNCPTTSGSPTGTAHQSTSDPVVPAQRLDPAPAIHQYRGGHDESYGGVTINIDNDYVDGATVGEATLPPTPEDNPVGALDLAKRAGAGPGAGPRLGLRPERPHRTAGDPPRRRRQGRRTRRRLLRPRAGREPAAPRRPPAVPGSGRPPRLRPQPADGEVGAPAGLRLRPRRRTRRRHACSAAKG